MSTEKQITYRFGEFRLDARRRILMSADDDEPVALTPKALDLLLYLVEHTGELVPKQELLGEVWPNIIVEENNLTQAISAVRRALGERPNDHRYIATVPGRGYRFVAEVQEQAPADQDVTASGQASGNEAPVQASGSRDQMDAKSPKRNHRLMKKIVVGTAGIVLLALVVYGQRRGTGPVEQAAIHAFQVTGTQLVGGGPGNHTQPTLSPDGSRVAFVNDAFGTPHIYVKNIASGAPVQITYGEVGASSPSWSPLEDRIIYQRDGGGIWSVDPMGTLAPRLIIEDGTHPSFSWDGGNIVYEHENEIRIANADGSGQRTVEGAPGGNRTFADAWPSLSPDGTKIVMFAQAVGPLGDYWIVSTDKAEAQQLTFDRQWGGKPAWTSDGQIVFPSKRGGTLTLWRLLASGGEPNAVTTGLGADRDPVMSRDGRRLIYTHTRYESFLIVTDTETGNEEVLYSNRRLLAFPRVSPDSTEITFFAEVEPRQQIMVMNTDGSELQQLTEYRSDEANIMPRWSPDGQAIYYYQNMPPASLRRIELAGGPSEVVFTEFNWQRNMDAEPSPSGRQIAFVRLGRASAGRQVVIRALDSGEERLFSPGIVFAPSWSSDGRYLLGGAPHGVLICPVSGAACTVVIDDSGPDALGLAAAAPGYFARWSSDESQIFFTRRVESPAMRALWVVDRDGSDPRHLLDYGPVHPLGGRFEVLDGNRILWFRYEQRHTELVLAEFNRNDS